MYKETIEAIVKIVGSVEDNVDSSVIRVVVESVLVKHPPALRILALLQADPNLLVSATPAMPRALIRIATLLEAKGASSVRRPLCGRCKQPRHLIRITGGSRICGPCHRADTRQISTCWNCRQTLLCAGNVMDRSYCSSCWRSLGERAPSLLRTLVKKKFSRLTDAAIDEAIAHVQMSGKRDHIARLFVECDIAINELFAKPAAGSVAFAAFYDSLRFLGAPLSERTCGHCHQVGKLGSRRDGLICCRKCYRAGNLAKCGGCGNVASMERRQPDGSRLCQRCTNALDDESASCSLCGNHRLIAARSPAGPVCSTCRSESLVDVCGVCQKEKPCRFAGSDQAICQECRRAQSRDACRVCGNVRTCRFPGTEKAVCNQCANLREPCLNCG